MRMSRLSAVVLASIILCLAWGNTSAGAQADSSLPGRVATLETDMMALKEQVRLLQDRLETVPAYDLNVGSGANPTGFGYEFSGRYILKSTKKQLNLRIKKGEHSFSDFLIEEGNTFLLQLHPGEWAEFSCDQGGGTLNVTRLR